MKYVAEDDLYFRLWFLNSFNYFYSGKILFHHQIWSLVLLGIKFLVGIHVLPELEIYCSSPFLLLGCELRNLLTFLLLSPYMQSDGFRSKPLKSYLYFICGVFSLEYALLWICCNFVQLVFLYLIFAFYSPGLENFLILFNWRVFSFLWLIYMCVFPNPNNT